jgi:hypothetical protein
MKSMYDDAVVEAVMNHDDDTLERYVGPHIMRSYGARGLNQRLNATMSGMVPSEAASFREGLANLALSMQRFRESGRMEQLRREMEEETGSDDEDDKDYDDVDD